MQLLKSKYTWIASTFILATGYIVSCTKDNQVLDLPVAVNGTELFSQPTSAAPVIDGIIDPVWESAAKLSAETEVPNPGNGMFAGYVGDKYKFTLRSLYDNQFIYFLAEYNDLSEGTTVQPWYFDPTTKRWAQEPNARQFNVNGALIREGIGQDQLAFLWNIDNSTAKFASQTCYASCHLFTPYRNFQGAMVANKSGNHYTNAANEKIDMWWLHLNKDLLKDQMDDEYQDWAGGPSITDTVGGSGNGRHADDLVPPSPFSSSYVNTNTNASNGPINNRVTLKLGGTGANVNVPAWIIPDAVNKAFIDVTDTLAGGTAKKVVGVSTEGVLTFADNTTLDPTGVTDYQQLPGVYAGLGAKCIPSFISVPYTGGRADFTAKGVHTGTGWVVEFKRLLNTNSSLKQDVNFESLQDQPFGMAIFNNANYQHSIKTNLLLKFKL